MIMNVFPINVSCNRNLKVRKHFLCKLHTDLVRLLRSDVIVLLEALIVVMSYDTFVLIESLSHILKLFISVLSITINKGSSFTRSGIDLTYVVKAFTEIFFHIVQRHCLFFFGDVADSVLHVHIALNGRFPYISHITPLFHLWNSE